MVVPSFTGAAITLLSGVIKYNSLPSRRHLGSVPPVTDTCHLPPEGGKLRTYTWKLLDSSEM
ncbi:MAG: hypothetical protein JJE04_09990 [Acidobacteriia bacterium]|nr:hypothetical protein [Terriglobia bacterium]